MAYTDEQMRQTLAEYGPSVWRLALTQLRSTPDAEDVYQEVFLRLVRHSPRFESAAHQKAWLLRVTANCCKDTLKKRHRKDVPLEDWDQLPADPQENAYLSLALDTLNDTQRLMIHLHYYEGYKTEEIAKMLGINHSTVRSHLKRARKRLKDFMEGEMDDV